MGFEVIRMHELQACEVSLLWRSGSAVWSAEATVHGMSAHVDDSSEEARSPAPSNTGLRAAPSSRGRPYARPALLEAPRRGVAGVPVSLPPR